MVSDKLIMKEYEVKNVNLKRKIKKSVPQGPGFVGDLAGIAGLSIKKWVWVKWGMFSLLVALMVILGIISRGI